jgi:hypothetical protein
MESIDVLDAMGWNIRINSRGPKVMRSIPRLHEVCGVAIVLCGRWGMQLDKTGK